MKLDIFYGDPGEYRIIDKLRFVELAGYNDVGIKMIFTRDIEAVANDPKKLVTSSLRLGDFAAGSYMLAGRYDNGFYVRDAENRPLATTREWKPDAIDSAHFLKYSKTLFFIGKPSTGFDRVIGHPVEFVPQKDPFTLKKGMTLPVLLLINGKPKPNYKVEIGDDKNSSKYPGTTTDKNGIFSVPVDYSGYYRLAVDYREKSKYPDLFEFNDYTASLVFMRQ